MIVERCARHAVEPSRHACNECADAFEAARDALLERNHRELDERRALHRQRTLATAMCELCDDNGRRSDGRPCSHDVGQDERNARGVAACRAAIAS